MTGKLINIDNGGTLTDICVIDGSTVTHTKTLTTPYDLSKCFLDGLRKAARLIYGSDDRLDDLLLSTDHIRYSTTQGTNAIVERKGPRLGFITCVGADLAGFRNHPMFEALVADRVAEVDADGVDDKAFEASVVAVVTQLTTLGANRIVVGFDGQDYRRQEARFKDAALRKFPRHLLGVVPVLCAGDLVNDAQPRRRLWTALLNAFLHPVMENFLYNAEGILREHGYQRPLLIFRNDGDSASVSRTVALKTYSSGPRGGMEGALALARHYGAKCLLSMDIGGTTTDIGLVQDGRVKQDARGHIEDVQVSIPLVDVVSAGVGGSSILKVVNGHIEVGPESTGGVPGPACFGLGGQLATITDVFLLTGLIDQSTYFGGAMKLDAERARSAILTHIAKPLGLTEEAALVAAERAWGAKIAANLLQFMGGTMPPDTMLAAFGGAGPFIITALAEASGVRRAIIPGLAAVFSAFGIGFSNIGQRYELPLPRSDPASLSAAVDSLLALARRDMFAEGFDLGECEQRWYIASVNQETETDLPWKPGDPVPGSRSDDGRVLRLNIVREIPQAQIATVNTAVSVPAVPQGTRRLTLPDKGVAELPVYRVIDQPAGARGDGPCILEEPYFTGRVDAGWRFEIQGNRDTLLTRVV